MKNWVSGHQGPSGSRPGPKPRLAISRTRARTQHFSPPKALAKRASRSDASSGTSTKTLHFWIFWLRKGKAKSRIYVYLVRVPSNHTMPYIHVVNTAIPYHTTYHTSPLLLKISGNLIISNVALVYSRHKPENIRCDWISANFE